MRRARAIQSDVTVGIEVGPVPVIVVTSGQSYAPGSEFAKHSAPRALNAPDGVGRSSTELRTKERRNSLNAGDKLLAVHSGSGGI